MYQNIHHHIYTHMYIILGFLGRECVCVYVCVCLCLCVCVCVGGGHIRKIVNKDK